MTRKAVLITGCSSGIGYRTAQILHAENWHVIASARGRRDVARLRAEGLDAVHLDLRDSASIERGVDDALELTGGTLWGLFNNGGYSQPGAVEDLRREVLRAQFETNVFGTHELTRRIIPFMRAAGAGRIIQNSSILGYIALPFRGAYNASKHALEGLTDTLRLELRQTDIKVSLIQPGPIASALRAKAYQAFVEHIDADASVFAADYRRVAKRLVSDGPVAPFTLEPDAVAAKVRHALTSDRPKARYSVTGPAYLFTVLKRCLSSRALDRFLAGIGHRENRD